MAFVSRCSAAALSARAFLRPSMSSMHPFARIFLLLRQLVRELLNPLLMRRTLLGVVVVAFEGRKLSGALGTKALGLPASVFIFSSNSAPMPRALSSESAAIIATRMSRVLMPFLPPARYMIPSRIACVAGSSLSASVDLMFSSAALLSFAIEPAVCSCPSVAAWRMRLSFSPSDSDELPSICAMREMPVAFTSLTSMPRRSRRLPMPPSWAGPTVRWPSPA